MFQKILSLYERTSPSMNRFFSANEDQKIMEKFKFLGNECVFIRNEQFWLYVPFF